MWKSDFLRVHQKHGTQDADGWYLGGSYRFTDYFEVGGYYSESYNNTDDRDGEDTGLYVVDHRAWLKDICLTLRFDINEYWIVKLEGHRFNGTTTLLPHDNPPDENGKKRPG